jgi:myo-inositol catabolism protein IolS
MERRALGPLEISVMGLGCWPLGGGPGWGDQDEREAIATIHAALDHGINLLDTAEMYNDGRSEEVVGLALQGRRERAIVATKVMPQYTAPATLRAHCEASLRRLRTDYIDLYQVHWPIGDGSVEEAFATLQELQRQGKVRAIGVSNHGVRQLGQVLATGAPIVSNQLCYSLIARAIEFEILPFCRSRGIAVMAYMPLMQGLLTGKYATADDVPPFRARTRHFSRTRPETRHGEEGAEEETFAALGRIRGIAQELGVPMAHLALAWVAAQPGIATVLVGSRTPAQLQENLAAFSLQLAPEILARLAEATEALRRKLGPNADYWQGAEDSRIR